MHDHQHVQLFGLFPERIEVFAVEILAVHVRSDRHARKFELANRVFQDACGTHGILQRHRRHTDKALRIAFDQVMNAFVVKPRPGLALFSIERITLSTGLRLGGRDCDPALAHYLKTLVHVHDFRIDAGSISLTETQQMCIAL